MVVVGRVGAVFGVRGEVHVHSLTDPPENLLGYRPWYLANGAEWQECEPSHLRPHGRGLVVMFDGISDRDAAARLVGCEIAVCRSQLPETDEDEFYWADLLGMRVVTVTGRDLGTVDHIMATGANDVLVIRGDRERLVPFLVGDVVKAVESERGLIEVDWDPDF